MGSLYILADSSTKPSSSTNKYGESVVAWTAQWNSASGEIVKSGVGYIHHEGPNKAFYIGVIEALSNCYHLCYAGDKAILFGDCKIVIDQINGKPRLGSPLTPFWNQVQKIKKDYRCPVDFIYMPRNALVYSKVDQMAKRGRGFFRNNIVVSGF